MLKLRHYWGEWNISTLKASAGHNELMKDKVATTNEKKKRQLVVSLAIYSTVMLHQLNHVSPSSYIKNFISCYILQYQIHHSQQTIGVLELKNRVKPYRFLVIQLGASLSSVQSSFSSQWIHGYTRTGSNKEFFTHHGHLKNF